MSTILLPPVHPAPDEPEVQPAAWAVLADVRDAAGRVAAVPGWMRGDASPEGWEGEAARAARRATAGYAARAGGVHAALERVAGALAVYLGAMDTRRAEWQALEADRVAYLRSLESLRARIEGAPAEQEETLRAGAQRLWETHRALTGRLARWRHCVRDDEQRMVRALEAVETPRADQGRRGPPGRVDTDALLRRLARWGDDTDAVHAWWSSLGRDRRQALLRSAPSVVGSTDGIPTGDRDAGNRAAMEADLERLEVLRRAGELSGEQRQLLDRVGATREAMLLGENRVPPVDVNLVLYRPSAFGGDGAAAISYGDPDTAGHTAVIVPGMTSDMSGMVGQGQDALNLHDEAGGAAAVVAWMGYDAPSRSPAGPASSLAGGFDLAGAGDLAGVVTEQAAEAGGRLLGDFVDGLRRTHEGDPAHLTVIGHSYGSTTAAHAAADGLAEDSLVLTGSPGAGGGVAHVSGLDAPEGRVFVGSRDHDLVTWLGGEIPVGLELPLLEPVRLGNLGLGEDPAQRTFGATTFDVTGGHDAQGRYVEDLHDTAFDLGEIAEPGLRNHSSYFETGSDSLQNLARIVTGGTPADIGSDTGYSGAPDGRTRSAHDHLRDWAGEQVGRVRAMVRDPVRTFADVWPDARPKAWPDAVPVTWPGGQP